MLFLFAVSSKVTELRAKPLSSNSLLVEWNAPIKSNGVIKSYLVQYMKLEEASQLEGNGMILKQNKLMEEVSANANEKQVKLPYLEINTEYLIVVFPRNNFGLGERFVNSDNLLIIACVITMYNWFYKACIQTEIQREPKL